jgi:hypothetical protein
MTTLYTVLLILVAPIFGVFGLLEKVRELQLMPIDAETTEI